MPVPPAADLIRTDRSRTIQRSLRCFRFGLVGLLPIVGTVPALLAISLFRKVAHDTGDPWRPTWVRAGWLIALLYAGTYTVLFGLGGFLLIVMIGYAIQLAASWHAYCHDDTLAWNPARPWALAGISMAYSGLAGMALLTEAWIGFVVKQQLAY
jgi:hypothetical protein